MTREQRQRKARRLHRNGEGLTVREIAEELGVSPGTVHRDVNPEAAERYRLAGRERKRRAAMHRRDIDSTEVKAT